MNQHLTAWIFTLGTELTQGRVVNTNGSHLGRRLTLLGFKVLGILTLVDDVNLITKYLLYVLNEKPKLIVTTGGLGPTPDDLTLEAIAKALNRRLILNAEAFEMVKRRVSERGFQMTPERAKMAYLPEGGVPIPNPVGTAPGCWIEYEGTIIISLPGVPKEMEAMWESWVEPRIRKLVPNIFIAETTIETVGVPEASLAPLISRIMKSYTNVYIKSHPKGLKEGKPWVDVYIMVSESDKDKASGVLNELIKTVVDFVVSLGGSAAVVETRAV
jgi:molybdenum cofactor synthesis domain-containing protein